MTVTGIIAEFNPFHNGHKYLLSQAEGIKIVAMSGNFVQRGEPAIVDKWTRAEMALRNGADLVVELPLYYSIQNAEIFSSQAVKILEYLELDIQVFGAEEENLIELEKVVQLQSTKEYKNLLKEYIRKGNDYNKSNLLTLDCSSLYSTVLLVSLVKLRSCLVKKASVKIFFNLSNLDKFPK